MSDELERRAQDLLDAGKDPLVELREELTGDPKVRRDVAATAKVDRLLREWPMPSPSAEAFEAMAMRVEQRLGEELAPLDADPTAPPVFEDVAPEVALDPADVSRSGEYSLSKLAAAVGGEAPPPPAAPIAGPAPNVVPLPPREDKRSPIPWMIAAAAAAGLAVSTTFMLSSSSEPAAEVASQTAPSPSAVSPAPVVTPPASVALGGPAERERVTEVPAEEPLPEATAGEPAEGGGGSSSRRGAGSRTRPMVMEADLAPSWQDELGDPEPPSPRETVAAMASAPRAPLEPEAAPPAREVARGAIARSSASLRACFDTAPGTVRARVRVRADTGRVEEIVSLTPSNACAREVVQALRLEPTAGAVVVERSLSWELR